MNHLEDDVTRILDDRAAAVEVRDGLDAILTGDTVIRFEQSAGRASYRPQLLVAAAAVAIVGAGILGIAQLNGGGDAALPPAQSAAPVTAPPVVVGLPDVSARWLSDIDSIGADDWIYPTVLPDGFVYQYASRNVGAAEQVQFGRGGSASVQLNISISSEPFQPSGDTIDVGGRSWTFGGGGDFAIAVTMIGDEQVSVGGPVTQAELESIVGGLAVIAEADLPSAPLTYDDVMNDVGDFDVNGQTVTMSVNESNGWYCIGTRTASSGGGGCATYFDPTETISRYHGGESGNTDGSSDLLLSTRGMASTNVARIDVDFVNGVTASVTPQNTSGMFPDVKFWAVGAVAPLQPGQDPDAINELFTEIRAYDSAGNLLASRGPIDASIDDPSLLSVAILHGPDQAQRAAALRTLLEGEGITVEFVGPSAVAVDADSLMPLGSPHQSSFLLADLAGIGGFDTWSPALSGAPLPATVTDVFVLGAAGG